MPDVKCYVSNCHYWEKGNDCSADSIEIEVDQHAGEQGGNGLNTEFASELGSLHQDEADKAAETCCLTFKPQEEAKR